jgi:hippurate hydrolase
VRAVLEARLRALAESFAAAQGCRAEVAWMAGYPAVVNAPAQTEIAIAAAGRVGAVDPAFPPLMAAEDFAYMLQARPGAFILLGNGRAEDGSFHHVHTPMFDFNDAAIPYGVGYWLSLVAQELGG